ncbi:LOW QUALITY PROTEIN: macrophage mannose receptor 1-like [Liolophura sinensis]|uniref:LOW QUALITY PROTEIN: macrophage mannose receptor 1-like n=1 Tax=Liolophura sinensis TaxID=3198878 RepID=UPI0031581D6A
MDSVRWLAVTLAALGIQMARSHVCPPGWWDWPSGTSCYKITTSTMSKSWTDARLSCQAYQGDLVVINSAAEQSWLRTQFRLMSMADPDLAQWWGGATNLNERNQWTWIDGSVASSQASPWQKGQPDNHKGSEHCVYVKDGGLNDEDCAVTMPYVCERWKNVTLKCDIDSGWENYHNYCYKFFTTKRSWREAHDVCDNEGGRLATVLLDSIERHVIDSVNNKQQNAWIGLRSVPSDAGPMWRWTYLNIPLRNGYWAVEEASVIQKDSENSSCAEVVAGKRLNTLKAWNNADCSQRKAHICEKPEGVCAEGWIQYQSKCYEIQIAHRLTWSQAYDYCRAHGTNGSLVEINSPLEQSFMNKLLNELKESGVRQMWIGLMDDEAGGVTYGSGAAIGSYKNWDKAPSDTPNKFDCGMIYTGDKQGKWSLTTSCFQLRPFICQLPTNVPVQAVTTPKPEMSCEPGWALYMNQCLLFNDTVLDWMEAQHACQGQSGRLVSVQDESKQSFINGRISSAVMWTGLNDRSEEGSFNWADGTMTTFTNWYSGYPHKKGEMNCVGMVSESGHAGQWKDLACNAKHGFICQKPALINGVTPAPGSTPTTLTWSARCGPNWEEDINLGFCYSFQDRPLSWLDAGQWCSQNGGQLASITTIQEQYFIAGRARSMSSFAVWIGANDRDDNRWMWTDGSPFAYLNWKPGEPNNPSSENCVNIVVSSGLWNNYRCDSRNGFVCKKSNGIGPPTSVKPTTTVQAGMTFGCPKGWNSYKNKCYLFKSQRGDQPAAVLQCRQLGADLVSIADVDEQNFISSQVKGYGQYWIGLNDREIEWTYRWTDGAPVTFTSWSPSEPNNFENKDEDCVTMYAYGKHSWNDQLCNFQAQGYVCKSPQKPVTSTTVIPGCPPSAYLYEGNCYSFVDTRKSFTDAERQCVSLGGHLATIADKYQQAYLSSELSGLTGQYWIGLKKISKRYTWTSKQNLTYTFWSKAHTGLEKNTCIAMSTDKPVGVWQDVDCHRSMGFICQVRQGGYTTPLPTTAASTLRPVTCPSGWQEHQGYCYKAFYSVVPKDRLMWSEAVANCRGYGGDLVSYQNKSEEDFVYQSVLKFYWRGGDFWIGLSSRELLQGYHWSDGSPFGYNNWGPDQPDNRNDRANCVAYNQKNNNWFHVSCFVANNWICKLKKGVVPPTSVVPPTAVSAPSCGGPDSKWKYYRGMCYFVSVSDKKTWYEARDWCHQNGAHLTSIHSKTENDVLTSLTAKLTYGIYWIGLNSLNLDGFKWSDSTMVEFVNWAKNEPNDGYGGQRCVDFYNFNGGWNDDNCADKNEFICRKVNGSYSPLPTVATTVRPGNCPKGFHGYKSKCFFLGGNTRSSLLNWTAAHDKCRSFGSGYEIASVSNDQEQAFLTSLLGGWNTSLWIGLNDLKHENQFSWVDNSENSYFNWAKGEPSGRMYGFQQEDCVHMYAIDYHAGKWNDENCDLLHGYICQVYKSPSFPNPETTPLPSWCKSGYTLYGKNCYKLMPDPVSWFRAKSTCRLDGSVLASITSVYEESVVRVLTQDINQPVWIGMHDAEVSGTYEWIDNWPIFYTNWAQGEPSKDIGEGCVSLLPNGKWNDTICGQQFLPVCKLSADKPPPVTSPYPGHCADKSWNKWGDMCYYVQMSPRSSWPEAKFTCERKGMQLVSIHSRTEADYVYKLVMKKKPRYGSSNVWIGLLKGVTTGFQWADNSYVDFVTWEEGEPSDVNGTHHEDCAELQTSTGHWNDLPCTTDRGFVCKTPALGIPTTSTSVATTTRQRILPATSAPPRRSAQPTQASTLMPWVPRKTLSNSDHSRPISNHQQAQGSSNTSAGTIVGICVGVLLALALVAAVLIVLKRRQRFVYKSGHPTTSFDNVLYPTSSDGVSIQEDLGNTNNGHLQSSST